MAKQVALDKLGDAIKEILDDYADDINNGLNDAVKDVTRKGVVAVRAKAREIVKQPGKDGKPKIHQGLVAYDASQRGRNGHGHNPQ